MAKRMNARLERVNQTWGKPGRTGTTLGTTDSFLIVAGHCRPVEMKVPPNGLSQPQLEAFMDRLEKGVETDIVTSEFELAEVINWCRRNPRRLVLRKPG
jgi:hypothetical protein